MFPFWDCLAERFIRFAVSCIESIIAGHFEVFFWDMLYEEGNKIQDGEGSFHIGIVFMFIVMESDIVTVIGINARSSNDRSPKIPADIFHDGVGVTKIGFCIDIEAIFIFFINGGLGLFKGRANTGF